MMRDRNIHNDVMLLDLFDLFSCEHVELVLKIDGKLVGTLILELSLGRERFRRACRAIGAVHNLTVVNWTRAGRVVYLIDDKLKTVNHGSEFL